MSAAGHIQWRALAGSPSDLPIVWFDGRLDNRAALELLAGCGAGTSIAELLARGIERHGLKFVQELIGDYALAVIQSAAMRVHLVRDPTGQRPLLFSRDAEGVRFGALPSDLGIPLRVDLSGLAAFVAGNALRERRTGLASIVQVRPGEMASIDPDGVEYRSWWQPRAAPEPWDPTRDYPSEYRDLLDQATADRLSDGPVATHLSGGWDSNAVTAAAATLTGPGRLTAYTAVPWATVTGSVMRHSIADEESLAAATARLLGIRHQPLRHRTSPFAAAERFAVLAQAPVLDPFQIAWGHAIRDAARALGARTLLTGENGNLSLNASGLPMLRWLLRHGGLRHAGREVRDLVRAGQIRWRGAAAAMLMGRLPPSLMHRAFQLFAGGAQPTDASFIRPTWVIPAGGEQPSDNPHADRLAMMRNSDPGLHRVLAEREWGLREADPTADRRLVEWSLRLPSEALLHRGVLRPMAQAALQGRVAPLVLASNLRGLQAADWYQQVSAADCSTILSQIRDHAEVREFLDIDALERAIASWPERDWNSPENYGRYRLGVVGALCSGLFIARFSG